MANGRGSVVAVWTPDDERTVPPEALPELLESLRKRFAAGAAIDLANARRNILLFGIYVAWGVVWALSHGVSPLASQNTGLGCLVLLVFGLIPYYEAWKSGRSAASLDAVSLGSEEQEARFDYWLHRQHMPVTIVLHPEGYEVARLIGDADWASENAKGILRTLMGR